jgi:hypothetical protein
MVVITKIRKVLIYNMLTTIYGRAFKVLMKKPFKLWGISLLAILLNSVLTALCGFAIPALGIAVALLLSTSMTILFLKGYRGEEVNTTQLFSCFKDWNTIKRVVLGMAWMALWIFLWSLIPIVGPFIALVRTYEYRLTPYILVFEPEVAITDAIKISSQKTNGYKLQMWLADFVYIIVCFVAGLILGLLSAIPVLGVLFALVLAVFFLAVLAFGPLFVGLVQAAFYEEITSAAVSYCSGCGFKLTSDVPFCPNCGKPTK